MTRNRCLQDQAERAERLAATALDPLTVRRLNEFAAECRHALQAIHRAREITEPVRLPVDGSHLGVPVKPR
jgi:hypothetical protein